MEMMRDRQASGLFRTPPLYVVNRALVIKLQRVRGAADSKTTFRSASGIATMEWVTSDGRIEQPTEPP